LEDLAPEDNLYRQVERSIDLSFVHNLANDFYSNIGHPSIDPVVFFKLRSAWVLRSTSPRHARFSRIGGKPTVRTIMDPWSRAHQFLVYISNSA
jgi:hypothetical protein